MRCVSQRGPARQPFAGCARFFLSVNARRRWQQRAGAFADPGGGRMALFMVRPETRWPHDRARAMASAAALECDSRTVKQVTIPVHGATRNGAPQAPLPAPRPQTPCDRRPAGRQPRGVACSNAGQR